MTDLQLNWLGPPAIEYDGRPFRLEMRKTLALLAYLSLSPQRRTRETLASLFWPEYDQQRSLCNLRRNLSSLSKSLPFAILETDRETIGLSQADWIKVDVNKFQALIALTSQHSHPADTSCLECISLLDEAVDLYRGDFLEGFTLKDCPEFDVWQFSQRESLRSQYAGAQEKLARYYAGQDQWEMAIAHARSWLAMDRLHEPAQRMLMQLYLLSGQKSAAIHQYEECERLLEQELDQSPEPETRKLYEGIRSSVASEVKQEQKVDPLIRTKLHPPFIRPNLVPRPRLQACIAEGLRYPLTLVIAPAGFGKTTLVAASLADCPLPVAWLSLDKDDNQAGRFLIYLLAALQGVDPQIGKEAAQLMAGMQPASPEAVLTRVINDLDRTHTEMVLVLDDYQFIFNLAVHQVMAFLIEHCPNALHLLIAARSDPPLPLARLRARGQMVELRTTDLRFAPGEAAQFLSQVMGLSIDEHSVAVLEERTEGWIAGLQMAALSLRDCKDVARFIQDFSGTNRHILDYLLEEILAGQSPEVQRFLLCTSILNRLTAPLCDAILKDDATSFDVEIMRGDSRRIFAPERSAGVKEEIGEPSFSVYPSSIAIEYLGRENLFLVALDDERTWFRYHHLFQDLLRARLQQAQAGMIPVLHMRASAWLEQHGFIPEAIQHLITAQKLDQAADLIERYGPGRWAEGDASVVQLLDRLPPEMLISRPKIGLYQAWLLINQANIEKAIPLLSNLVQHLATVESEPGCRWIQTVVSLAMTFLFPHAVPTGSDLFPDYELLEEIPAGELVMRDVADVLYGMTLGRRGEIDRVVEVATRCIQREQAHPSPLAVPSIGPYLAYIYLEQGRLHAAASLCNEYLKIIKEKDSLYIAAPGCLNVLLGVVLYKWNRLDEAELQIREGLHENEPWQAAVPDGFGLGTLIHIFLAKRDYAAAMQIVDQFETRFQSPARPVEFQEDFHTLRVRVQFASGNVQQVFQWADQILRSEDFLLHEEYYRLTLARIRLGQGRYAEVEKMLTGSTLPVGMANQEIKQLEYEILRAAAIAGQNRLPEAFEIFEACLALTEPEGNMRIYLDAGEPIRELLAAYLRSAAPVYKLYAQKLLDAFSPLGGVKSPHAQSAELVEPLSERELEVLHLLSLGQSNQEIAGQLYISPGTVKAHTSSIYRKLDVANRTEAVTRARQIGLLT